MKVTALKRALPEDDNDAILNTVIDNFDGYVWSVDRFYRSLYRNSRLRSIMTSLYGDAPETGEQVFSFLESVDPELARKWEELYRVGFEGLSQRIIHQFNHDDHAVVLELSINPVYKNGKVTSLACFARDITREHQQTLTLRQIEKRFRVLIEKSHDGICLFDAQGNVGFVSASVTRIMGYTPDELASKPATDYIHPDDWGKMEATLAELAPFNGETRQLTYRVKHKNGEWRWICSNITNLLKEPSIKAFVINYSDQTERIVSEQSIANSEILYRSLFNNSPMPIWVCDKSTLAYLEVNQTAINVYGYTREEFLSMTAFDIRKESNRQDLDRVIEQGCAGFRNRLRRHIKKNGEITFSEVTVQEIVFRGKPAYLVISNDITDTLQVQHKLMNERVKRQVEVTKATIAAQEQERDEVGKELHDNVNQMLATVKLYIAAAYKEDGKSNTLLAKSLEIIDDSINEIRKICKSLVPPSLGQVSLKESLEALIQPVKLTEKSIRLCMNDIGEETINHALKISIYRIVQEQINNILKYSHATCVIISLQRANNTLDLKIADNGIGFDPKQKPNGIGFTNIRNRINTFNGKVVIESSPGNGCKVLVTFDLQ